MRSRRPWRFFALLAASAAWGIAVGCSSFSGDSAPVTPGEAGVETSGPVEAAADAGDAAARFCKTVDAATALFCADFDEGPIDAGWQLTYLFGGKLESTPSDRSAPNALLTTIDTFARFPVSDAGAADSGDAGDGGTLFGAAVLSTTFGRGDSSGAILELDMRIDELPSAADGGESGGILAGMGFDVDTRFVSLSFFNGVLYFAVSDPALVGGQALEMVSAPSPPRWFHLRMLTHFNGSSAELSFDGIKVAGPTQGLGPGPVGLVLNVGPSVSATGGKARVAYDNITLTLLPP